MHEREARQSAASVIALTSLRRQHGDRIEIVPTTNRRDFRRNDVEYRHPFDRHNCFSLGLRLKQGKVSLIASFIPKLV